MYLEWVEAMSQSDTPRVEEAHRWIWAESGDPVARYRLCLDFARRLERELAEAQRALAAERERGQAALEAARQQALEEAAHMAEVAEINEQGQQRKARDGNYIALLIRALKAARKEGD